MTDVERAAALLRAGELVAFPTETVYGLGADATNPQALAKVFAAKGRPADHPLIVHLPADDHLERWARDIPDVAWELAEQFWPGPLTLILRRRPEVPDLVTGGQDTVGLRVPGHPLALDLLRAFGGGIAAPSANRFGRISPTTALHVREELGDRVPLILDGGPCRVGIESTIVDLSRDRPAILRPGMVGADALALVLGQAVRAAESDRAAGPGSEVGAGDAAAAPRVPGALAGHYAPATPLEIIPGELLAARLDLCRRAGIAVGVLARSAPLAVAASWLTSAADPASYAHELYARLRELDHAKLGLILVEEVPAGAAWSAVRDRLTRAAGGAGGGGAA
jgi:L-threonylcarbamoyladenylate synthase